MKNLIQIIFTCTFFLQAPLAISQLLIEAPVFKGKVKSTVTTTTRTDTSGYSNISTQGENFNETGQYTEFWSKNVDWELDEKVIYTRDEAGNVIKSASYSFGKASGKASYKYDGNNNLIQSKDSYGSKYVYVYNEKNLCIKEDEYIDGKMKYTTTYSYNEQGKQTEKIWSNVDGNNKFLTEYYKYNDKGNITEIKYDWVYEDSLELQDYSVTKSYNNKNLLFVSSQINAAGETTSSTMHRYDDYGNKTEMLIITVDLKTKKTTEEKHTTTYEYDATGNWIKRTSFTNGVVNYTEERVITYY